MVIWPNSRKSYAFRRELTRKRVTLTHSLMPGYMMFLRHKAPGQPARQELQSSVYQRRPAAFLERSVEVTYRMQLVVDPAQIYLFVEMPQRFARKIFVLERPDYRLRREHSAFHRGVNALDALPVQKRPRIADDQNTVRI